MRIVLNGEAREVSRQLTVAELVTQEGLNGVGRRGVAVAVDAEVIPRSAWERTKLSDGQSVELLAAMQGG